MTGTDENTRTSSLARGLSLLELFSSDERELSISEMARRSGIPKSTTHRLVNDFLAWGALERGHNGVRLGVRMFELGNLVMDYTRMRELAIPFANSLSEITRLTVNFAVRDGDEILYVEKLNSKDLLVPHSRIGGRLPLHCTALGKAILAFSPSQFVDSVLEKELIAKTPKTITNPDTLRRELAGVRQNFVGYDLEESQPGLFCVASPIFARNRQVLGAISVTDAVSRSQARGCAVVVLASAQAFSRALGYGPKTQQSATASDALGTASGVGRLE